MSAGTIADAVAEVTPEARASTTAASNLPAQPARHPVLELLARYKAVFLAAWTHRAELAGPQRLADEVAFLPAALSLQDTPVHPASRRLAWGLMLLFVLAILWASLGKIDIVAVAPGRIIVSERTKVIQPLEASVVKRVLVKDGDRVHAGQVLVELDPTEASADKASVQEQLATAQSEQQRTTALLQALHTGQPPILPSRPASTRTQPTSGRTESSYFRTESTSVWTESTSVWTESTSVRAEPVEALAQTQAQLQSEWQDISAKLARLDAEAARHQAEMATVQASIAKLQATLPLARAREADFKRLVDQGYMSNHATQDRTRERVELEQDLNTQQARLAEAASTLRESAQTKAALKAETTRQLSDRRALATTQALQLQAELAKADQRERLTQLTAPVDGVIQQLAIHSVGGVVTSAQPLMIVVPGQAQVTAEVNISNQDIGFVNAGQLAEVKLETFPYTRYGTVDATVNIVTADAVTDEKRGSYYPATLTLSQNTMDVDGKRVPLSPGMNITAEIKTGQRRVIEFLLSPVQRAGSESFRER
ncbi:HlyD family type I secretion periplasmic adaptor subunit [Hydrogenophaga sp.]|uniref:HlyD family type I secretion periplasmic adaptor subunit n=1 Tax=Hydrogenophaga sp. TaxID=1904254 RepID=UPI0035654B8E